MTLSMPKHWAETDPQYPLDEATELRARAVCADYGNDPANLLEILHHLQDELGHINPALQAVLAEILNIGKAEVHGVISFYHDFRSQAAGKVVVKLCRAESCQAVGATALIERILQQHGLQDFGTTATGITIEPVYCLGNCALGPSAMVGEKLLGRITETSLAASVASALEGEMQ